jgi:hypothetical protein
VASTHIVESTPETVRSGYLDPAAKPVAVIQPGDTVRYPNTWTRWGNEAKFGMSFADREPLRHRYPRPVLDARPGGSDRRTARRRDRGQHYFAAYDRVGLELLPAGGGGLAA